MAEFVNAFDNPAVLDSNADHWGIGRADLATVCVSYTGETGGGFTAGDTVTGATSAATGVVVSVIDYGTTGDLYLKSVSGTFQVAENLQVSASTRGVSSAVNTGQQGTNFRLTASGAAPTARAPKGSFHINYATGAWYVNVDGATTWAGTSVGIYTYTTTTTSTGGTSSASEVTFTSFDPSIPANTLAVGDTIDIECAGTFTATHTTDTATIRLKIGGTTVCATAAVDVADNDTFSIRARLVVRTVSATGVVVADGFAGFSTSGSAARAGGTGVVSGLDMTAALAIICTVQFSASDAGNTARFDAGTVRVVRAA